MSDLSPEARKLIGQARPAELPDPSARSRVRAALAVSLSLPPGVPPSGAAGSASAGATAATGFHAKLVLMCAITAAAAAGTTLAVTHVRSSARPAATPPHVRVGSPDQPFVQPLPAPAAASPDPASATASVKGWPGARLEHRALAQRSTTPGQVSEPGDMKPTSRPVRSAAALPRPSLVRQDSPQGTTGVVAPMPPATLDKTAPPPSPSAVPWIDHSQPVAATLPTPTELPAATSGSRTPEARSQVKPDSVTPTGSWPEHDRSARDRPACSAQDEIRLLAGAQTALREGRGARALALLDEHTTSCPAATFREEHRAARVLALCLLDRRSQALAEAARLAHEAPRSPQLARLRSSCAAAALAVDRSHQDRSAR